MTEIPGVFARHDDTCPRRNGRRCTCGPLGYRSSIRDWETNHRVLSPRFRTISEAQAWQSDQTASLRAIRGVALEGGELGDVIDEFLRAGAEGRVGDRWNESYTPDGLRDLRGALSYVDAELGLLNVADVRRHDVQGLVDRLVASELPTTRVYEVVDALDALYAYAIQNDVVGFSPVVWLTLPEEEGPVGHDDEPDAPAHHRYPSGAFEPPFRTRSLGRPALPAS